MTENGPHHVFWADDVADRIEERDPDEPIVIKGGVSPSGVPHLGNANEIVLGYFVAEVLRERGREVRQVFTADDRDPLRKLPRKLADLDGTLVDLGDVDAAALGRNLGRPYTAIPDPFGCCESYGAHFTELIADIATDLSMPIDIVSTTELYESGAFDDAIRIVLERREEAATLMEDFQDKVDVDYIPFKVHCEACGKETETITDIDLEHDRISYECTDIRAGNRTIEGCGETGTRTLRDGKLPWRFEWPAQWDHLAVDFEPFGKDHAEGSWPSGVEIATAIFEIDPPVPMTYEWFTLEGQPFSSSEGHVILVSDVLELVEAEVLRAFFARDPSRASDFSVERLDQLVDWFDRLEEIALERREADPDETAFAERVYPFLVEEIHADRVRIPYRFAAVLGMTENRDLRESIARKEGHIPDDTPQWAVDEAMERVDRARRWAIRTDNEYNYELHREEIPEVSIDDAAAAALEDVASIVEADAEGERIQKEIFSAARRHELQPGELFRIGYRLFLGRDEGPQLGPFLGHLDRDFVVDRLRRIR